MEPNVRLKRVSGKQTTTLTHYGRRTGKPHEVTIWFVPVDDKLYIGTANVKRQWVRDVQKTPKIRLSIGILSIRRPPRLGICRALFRRFTLNKLHDLDAIPSLELNKLQLGCLCDVPATCYFFSERTRASLSVRPSDVKNAKAMAICFHTGNVSM
jgi:hypothetical protein